MFFQEQDFYIWMKGKNRLGRKPLITHTGEPLKIVLKRGEAWLILGDFT